MLSLHDFLILILMLVIIYVRLKIRKQNELKEKSLGTKDIVSFKMKYGIKECFRRVATFAESSGYTVKTEDEENSKVVLEENSADGFIFLIFLTRVNEGKTMVDVGIKSKTFETGPMMERRHIDFVDELRQEII